MNLNLNDKVIFIAGSSKGIGKGIANEFLKEGASVVITGRNHDDLKNAFHEFSKSYPADKMLLIDGDLQEPSHVKKAIEQTIGKWGKIDSLIANIGSGKSVMDVHVGMQEWERVFTINYFTSIHITEAILPHMIERKEGNIIFISSISGIEVLGAAPLAYCAAKSALINYSKNLSKRVGQFNIRVNCIAPGNILFKGGSWEQRLLGNKSFYEEFIQREVSLQKFGNVEDIAAMAVFLASEKASFITGSCMVVDGGQTKSI